MALLRIQLLGQWSVVHTTPVTTLASPRLQALLAWLVLHAGVPQSRSHLAFSFWPNSGEAQARTNLRKAIHHLQHALPDAERFVAVEGPVLTWRADAPYTLDVAAFETALHNVHTTAAIAHAVALYPGDLLPGCYDDWIVVERERLQQAFAQLLHRGITLHEAEHDYTQALSYAQRLVKHDPLHEAAYQQLMRLHALNGDRAAALRVYRTCVRMLQRELDVEPDQTTHDLYQRIRENDIVAAAAPSPAVPRPVPPTNLPVPLTPFIGREREVAAVIDRLRRVDVRLLTLTGTGGTGKTRIGLQAADAATPLFRDGVFFVNLAPLSTHALVPARIAHTLGLGETGSQPIDELLKAYLQSRHLLLLLDNFEHLLGAAPFIADLLEAAPHVKVLVTSRAPLHVYGEHTFAVPPLALPNVGRSRPAALLSNEAVQLFAYHAQAVDPHWALTAHNVVAVANICVRLDALPLAIELAAARVKQFPLEALAARSHQRLKLLTGGARDIPARQRTLRNTIDWSYYLLEPHEQALFTRLAVFVGGRSLDAIEAVCARDGINMDEVVDGVMSLVNKSLLRQRHESVPGGYPEPRFTMLDTMHEYAYERLQANGEAERFHTYHAAYFLQFAQAAEPELRGPQQTHWLQRLELEHDNLRAALSWALNGRNTELGLQLAAALTWFWYVHGHFHEGRRWLEQALSANAAAAPALRAKALVGAGLLAHAQSDYTPATACYKQALLLSQSIGNMQGVATALNGLGLLAYDQNDYAHAVVLQQESLLLQRAEGNVSGIAAALNSLGNATWPQGDYAGATEAYEESLRLLRSIGDKRSIGIVLHNLGSIAYYLGEFERAITLQQESLAWARELGDKRGIAWALHLLGCVLYQKGAYDQAAALQRESLVLRQELGNKHGIAECFESFAHIAGARGQADRAVRLFGAAAALREAINARGRPVEQARHTQALSDARTQLDESTFATRWAEGHAMSLEQAIAYVLDEQDGAFEIR